MNTKSNANSVQKWGIDLTSRTMWYQPWPIDINGRYKKPFKKDREEIYGISGEAIKETLLYFEERAALELNDELNRLYPDNFKETEKLILTAHNKVTKTSINDSIYLSKSTTRNKLEDQPLTEKPTANLIFLLNTHLSDDSFTITREELLDESRWYNNEYYFYFIMFTKKVMGRYDFHFGEGSNEQLSAYHKIFEQGKMSFIPWGKNDDGQDIKDLTVNVNLIFLLYLEKELNKSTEDFIIFINACFTNNDYTVKREFYNNESIWVNAEFMKYGYTFFSIFSNSNVKFREAANIAASKYLRIGHVVGNIPERLAMQGIKQAINKTTNIYKYTINLNKSSLEIKASFKDSFNIGKYGKYTKSILQYDVMVFTGSIMVAIDLIFRKNINYTYNMNCFDINDDYQYSITATWQKKKNSRLFVIPFCIASYMVYNFYTGSTVFHFYLFQFFCLLSSFYIIKLYDNNTISNQKMVDLQKNTENQLSQLEQTSSELLEERTMLEQKVQSRTAELNTANKKLTELDKAKTEFFANISHELRTPLTLIRTPLDAILKDELKPEKDLLYNMYQNSGRLLNLITTLLDFSKIEAGRLSLALTNTNLSLVVENALSAIASTMQQKKLKLIIDIDQNITACIDKPFFEKAFFNLLSNALKFTEAGGTIIITLKQKDYLIFLAVSDTGIGIPDNKLNTIFERFSQADSSSSRKYEGTGIGLSFAKEIIVLHNGTISVTSTEEEGSIFTITLNASEQILNQHIDSPHVSIPQQTHCTANLAKDTIETNGIEDYIQPAESILHQPAQSTLQYQTCLDDEAPQILIVEDTDDMRTLLISILTAQYRLLEAANGKAALELLDTLHTPPDLILSDVMMPKMDGYEMTTRLRNNADFESIPIILLTAKAAPENYLKGFEAGAIDYILKPFNSAELLSRIEAQLKMKLLRDKLQRSNQLLYDRLEKILKAKGLSSNTETEPTTPNDENSSCSKKIDAVETFLHENYMYDISREGIAAKVGLSPDYMSRLFIQYKGVKMFDYLRNLRLTKAAHMLKSTQATITTIAYQSGFDSSRTFNRQFKKKYNLSPHEYREFK